MKHHPLFKALAIFLAACAVLTGLISVVTIVFISSSSLYTTSIPDWQNTRLEHVAESLADQVLHRYTAKELGQCSPTSLAHVNCNNTDAEISGWYGIDPNGWCYTIIAPNGYHEESTYTRAFRGDDVLCYDFTMSCSYPVEVTGDEVATFDDSLSPYRDYFCTSTEEIYLYYFDSPEYTVSIKMLPDISFSYNGMNLEQATFLHEIRYPVIAILGVSLLIFVLCLVYLCVAAGKSPKTTGIRAGGLNRMPLDLYLIIASLACVGGAAVCILVIDNLSFSRFLDPGILALSAAAILAAAAVAVAFLFAMAAQFKMPGRYWWYNSITGKVCKVLWKGIRFLFRCVRKMFTLLPLIWQWLLIAATMAAIPLLFLWISFAGRYGFYKFAFILFALSVIADIGIILYSAYAFGLLLKGAKQMAEGDLSTKIPTQYLIGSFRDFANHLNALSDVAVVAAKNQMKSERMKTELITNVSHDIKTPLTSIINYVDLLEKPHSEEEGVQYLDVLSRQSQRLKKLIDDLMEMSKASTGNMQVNITSLDMAETVNQALGEFDDKLHQANLSVVFRQPEQPVSVLADGRLTWRVLSNLLSNIVKYALPGTRVYIDIARFKNNVLLSLKNISREELNVRADELTERFVRGDASRNTEGSGLGLNIAKSLMELQKGQLNLLVDGDLFKVTLTFVSE